jgi:hypothetical protein
MVEFANQKASDHALAVGATWRTPDRADRPAGGRRPADLICHSQTPPPPRSPRADATAFSDSAITFELQAWTDRFERWPAIATKLAIAVYAALRAAGMKIPFAQHEVRLLPDAPDRS